MNIIYGGSFNPPTIAHLNIIKKLLSEFENSRVILLPVGNDYKKPDLISFEHRYNMLKLFAKQLKLNIEISTIEHHKGYKGTFYALEELSKDYKNIYFVIGSDNLEDLKSWILYETLLKKYPFIVINRNQYLTKKQAEDLFLDLEHRFIFLDFQMDVSSTKIRENIDKNKNLLTPEVFQYIKNHKLYEVA